MAHSGQEDVGDGTDSDPWPFDPPATPLREGNGFGAFSADGHEYVIDLAQGQATPAPWSNVLANPRFGCVASESNTGYTWAENAHEFRLTPWHDDPVSDPGGRSEEHTSELQSLMRISYAVFCLKKKKHQTKLQQEQPETST